MRHPFSIRALFLFLSLAAFSLGGCVDARFKSSNSGSTGTVIDFGAPILMAVAVSTSGTGKYRLAGITYDLSLYKIVRKNDLTITRYFTSNLGPAMDPYSDTEVLLRSVAGFIRAAHDAASAAFASIGGFKVLTSPVTVLITRKAIPVLLIAVEGLAAVAAPGAAPRYACLAGDAIAFLSGLGNDQLSLTSPAYSTSAPTAAIFTESANLRSYGFNTTVDLTPVSVTVEFTLDGSGCAIRVNRGSGNQSWIGRPVAPLTSAVETFEQANGVD